MTNQNQQCGSREILIGAKHASDGAYIKILHDDTETILKLVHNQACTVENGNFLLTTSETCTVETDNISEFIFYGLGDGVGSIQISLRDFTTNELFAFVVSDNINNQITVKAHCNNLKYNLNNKKLLVEILSVCDVDNVSCEIPDFEFSDPRPYINLSCLTPTSTTLYPGYYCVDDLGLADIPLPPGLPRRIFTGGSGGSDGTIICKPYDDDNFTMTVQLSSPLQPSDFINEDGNIPYEIVEEYTETVRESILYIYTLRFLRSDFYNRKVFFDGIPDFWIISISVQINAVSVTRGMNKLYTVDEFVDVDGVLKLPLRLSSDDCPIDGTTTTLSPIITTSGPVFLDEEMFYCMRENVRPFNRRCKPSNLLMTIGDIYYDTDEQKEYIIYGGPWVQEDECIDLCFNLQPPPPPPTTTKIYTTDGPTKEPTTDGPTTTPEVSWRIYCSTYRRDPIYRFCQGFDTPPDDDSEYVVIGGPYDTVDECFDACSDITTTWRPPVTTKPAHTTTTRPPRTTIKPPKSTVPGTTTTLGPGQCNEESFVGFDYSPVVCDTPVGSHHIPFARNTNEISESSTLSLVDSCNSRITVGRSAGGSMYGSATLYDIQMEVERYPGGSCQGAANAVISLNAQGGAYLSDPTAGTVQQVFRVFGGFTFDKGPINQVTIKVQLSYGLKLDMCEALDLVEWRIKPNGAFCYHDNEGDVDICDPEGENGLTSRLKYQGVNVRTGELGSAYDVDVTSELVISRAYSNSGNDKCFNVVAQALADHPCKHLQIPEDYNPKSEDICEACGGGLQGIFIRIHRGGPASS